MAQIKVYHYNNGIITTELDSKDWAKAPHDILFIVINGKTKHKGYDGYMIKDYQGNAFFHGMVDDNIEKKKLPNSVKLGIQIKEDEWKQVLNIYNKI